MGGSLVALLSQIIAYELGAENSVEIENFGRWSVRTHEGYRGRDPNTGEAVDIPTRRKAYFKVSERLASSVADPSELEQSMRVTWSFACPLLAAELAQELKLSEVEAQQKLDTIFAAATLGLALGMPDRPRAFRMGGLGTFWVEESVSLERLANTDAETRTPADVHVDKVYFAGSDELAERLNEGS